jgi:tol-pal system protein YbgF
MPAAAQNSGGSILGSNRNRQPPPPVVVVPDPAIVRMNQRVDELENTIRELTGRLEEAERETRLAQQANERLGKQFEALSNELAAVENRFKAGEQEKATPAPAEAAAGAPPLPAASPPTGATVSAPQSGPSPAFMAAMGKLNAGDYQGAEAGFRGFLLDAPEGAEASDARFWLGEALYVQGAYGEAAQAYVSLLRANPNAARAPDALVKLAASLRQIDQPAQACAAIGEFRKRFPKATPTLKGRADAEFTRSACAG